MRLRYQSPVVGGVCTRSTVQTGSNAGESNIASGGVNAMNDAHRERRPLIQIAAGLSIGGSAGVCLIALDGGFYAVAAFFFFVALALVALCQFVVD